MTDKAPTKTELKKQTKQELIEYADRHEIEIDDDAAKDDIVKRIADHYAEFARNRKEFERKVKAAKAADIEQPLDWVLRELVPHINGHGFEISGRADDLSFTLRVTGRNVNGTYEITG